MCISTARVYEIERARRKRVGTDVVSKDLDVGEVYLGQKPQLQVGGDHASGRTDDISQPPGDRPSPSTDLQAPSALADSKTLNAPLRQRVQTVLQQLKTTRFVLGGMRERIVRCLTHSQNRKPRGPAAGVTIASALGHDGSLGQAEGSLAWVTAVVAVMALAGIILLRRNAVRLTCQVGMLHTPATTVRA